jgi:hypothetical protein
MKFWRLAVCVFFILCASGLQGFALDREAFSVTNYDLNVRIEPWQQRLAVRGKITLRNDTAAAQKFAVLQISSSLDWRSIKAGDKPLDFVSQMYTSDIDHTGALTEAIVTLPEAVPAKGTIDLEIAYEGVVMLDATRLMRIDTPESVAHSSDWDQISAKFTAVRGVGYVAWYPVATESASLTEGAELFETLGRWKMREANAAMRLHFAITSEVITSNATTSDGGEEKPELLVNATACQNAHEVSHEFVADCTYQALGLSVPTITIANFDVAERPDIRVHFLPGHDTAAANYADAAEKVAPLVAEWFGVERAKAETADLTDADATPFESGSLLLVPLASIDPKLAGLTAAHQLTHATFSSPRSWINEGLAHFAQTLYVERQSGRQVAIEYLGAHRSALAIAEKSDAGAANAAAASDAAHSLINTADDQLLRSKAMSVWWMLRDMVGDAALKKAIASYHPELDHEASYMPRLIQAQTKKDLEWFFDDWVYRDRGLPDFKIESVFPRKTLPQGYMVTVTVVNQGTAGAEVPVTVKFAGGEVSQRVVVRGKDKGVMRVEVPKPPEEVVVNDGSVPESDVTNNVFKVEAGDGAK